MAWVLARADPPSAPASLRPVLGFQRLPTRALGQVRRAVEEDDEFRRLVAAAVEDEADVGRAAWLWLHRPDGWEDELAALAEEAEGAARAVQEEKAERAASKRVAKAEAAVAEARAATATAERATAEARSLLDGERRARRAAEVEVERLRERVDRLEADRDRSVERANAAEATIGGLRAERAALKERVDELERQAAVRIDREALSRAVAEAGAAVARATELLDVPDVAPRAGRALRPPAGPRRAPAPLPAGLFDDTPEAAEHLVRVDGVTVLVDGYNAAKLAWPDEPLDEQRRRLVDALGELVGRCGCHAHVVFDGASVLGPATRPATRSVQVTFSPEGVTADDVLLELVDVHPLAQPVVVASSDREVRDGARARGANTISSPQLLAALGRYGSAP